MLPDKKRADWGFQTTDIISAFPRMTNPSTTCGNDLYFASSQNSGGPFSKIRHEVDLVKVQLFKLKVKLFQI